MRLLTNSGGAAGSKSAAIAVCYKKVKGFYLLFRAPSEAKLDEEGMGLATRVQGYQLNGRMTLNKAD